MEIEKALVIVGKIPVGTLDLNLKEKWDLTEAIDTLAKCAVDSVKQQRTGTITTKHCPIMGKSCIGERCAWWCKSCGDCAVPLEFGAVTDIATR